MHGGWPADGGEKEETMVVDGMPRSNVSSPPALCGIPIEAIAATTSANTIQSEPNGVSSESKRIMWQLRASGPATPRSLDLDRIKRRAEKKRYAMLLLKRNTAIECKDMGLSLRFGAFLALCASSEFAERAEGLGIQSELTCSRPQGEGIISLDRGSPTCSYVPGVPLGTSSNKKTSSSLQDLSDQVLLLRQTVHDLHRKLESQEIWQQGQTSAPYCPPPSGALLGDAQELLFEARQIHGGTKASFVELVSLTRRRDELFSLALSSVLVVVCSRDGLLEVRNVADTSNVVLFRTAHAAPVISLTVFPKGDDFAVLTTDEAGNALVHILNATRSESSETPTRGSGTGSQLRVAMGLGDFFSVSPGGSQRHNCVSAATIKGERMVLVGGSSGVVSVFSRSGVLKASVRVTNEEGGILHLAHSAGFTVFATRTCIGHINPFATHATGKLSCIGASFPIVSFALDPRKSGRVAVSLADGQVLYLDLKTWSILHKFPRVINAPMRLLFAKERLLGVPLSDSSTFAAAVGPSPRQKALVVFSLLPIERPDAFSGPSIHLLPLEMEIGPVGVLRRTGDTSLLALAAADDALVRIFECIHKEQSALSDESWAHIRLPIMLLTILVAVGAQVYRTKKGTKHKPDPEQDQPPNTADIEELWSERLRAEGRHLHLDHYRDSLRISSRCTDSEGGETHRENERY
ncbi:hypothetical protein cyc_03648 [Cyclospora cayetanensis]|uniref:Uncharacterized protein n=1 Tax=Cyclospora cayetanensis TaxID=88456 RepID=A0A1D3D4E6_9EIME|nr:hypothetical protein cyc_03648 [Cyclospora cayetanensis]